MNAKEKKNLPEISNETLVQDIEFTCRSCKHAKIAIWSSISNANPYLDDSYIKEKLKGVEKIVSWLPEYLGEANRRLAAGTLHADFKKRVDAAVLASQLKG